ncbi:MAG: SLC13 family permease, partial [Anaerolineae bacterium]|nr:SLC13 family permease [Anaerolineae bacterium]
IPLSYGALLGGATTLIGTTPNIIVSDLLREQGESSFVFFSYTPIGVLMLITGTTFMVTLGRRILPDHKPPQSIEEQIESPQEIMDMYRLPDNLFRLRVPEGSNLCGQTIEESRLGGEFGVNVLEILRTAPAQPLMKIGEQRLVLQSETQQSLYPTADTAIAPKDILIVQGNLKAVRDAVAYWQLVMQPASPADEQALVNQEAGIAEVVLPPRSSLVGKTLVSTRFGSTYKLTVLSISRPGADQPVNLKEDGLQFGDILLVQGFWSNIVALRKKPRDFVLMGRPEAMLGAPYRHKAPIALLILLGMLIALITGVADVATVTMAAGLSMILTGCLTMDDAYDAIDWKSIVLIAGMLPMSIALENVGLVSLIAEELTANLGDLGPLVIMAGLFLLTSAFTQVISNTATAVVLAPVAFATAQELNVQPQAFLMAVSVAASMAFASPVASPVNTLVMGAGSYRFKDYIKSGVPMIFLMLIVVLIGVPLLWPF